VESEIEGVLPVISLKSEGPVTIEYAYNGHPLFAIYKKKIGTKRVFRRGYDKLVKGKRCLIVEDVVSSGGTVDKTCQATKLLGGIVVAVAALADRSKGKVTKETLGVDDYYVLLRVLMEMEKEEKCRKCREEGFESVRTDLGKGNEFLQRKGLI
jgi:orotate phosphoribosyltransferase